MPATRFQVTFDTADPDKAARFWAAAHYKIQEPPASFDSWEGVPEERWDSPSSVVDPDGAGPRLYFQRVPRETRRTKNRSSPGPHADSADSGRRG